MPGPNLDQIPLCLRLVTQPRAGCIIGTRDSVWCFELAVRRSIGSAQEYWQSAGVLAERRIIGRAQDYWQGAGVLAARNIIGIAHRGGVRGVPPGC